MSTNKVVRMVAALVSPFCWTGTYIVAGRDKVLGKRSLHILIGFVFDRGVVGRKEKRDKAVQEHGAGSRIRILDESSSEGSVVLDTLQRRVRVSVYAMRSVSAHNLLFALCACR